MHPVLDFRGFLSLEDYCFQVGGSWYEHRGSRPHLSSENIDLDRRLKTGSLVFVDLLATVKSPSAQNPIEGCLRPFLDIASYTISDALQNDEVTHKLLIIFEDITSLLWLGFSGSHVDMSRFCRALRALCLKVSLRFPIPTTPNRLIFPVKRCPHGPTPHIKC